ncbi:unnamed protein product, partial [Meganyctiphanes norvegica]
LCVLLVTWFCRTVLWSSPVAAQGNCVFPFIYNGVSHNKCITENDPEGKLWCSTKTDEQNRHVKGGNFWEHCTVPAPPTASTRGSVPCQFPFIYKEVSYSTCITKDDPNNELWCSTKTDSQNNHLKGNYRKCSDEDLKPQTQSAVSTNRRKGCANTTDNSIGDCILIDLCPQLNSILKQVQNGGSGLEILRGSICENKASGLKVCCSRRKTNPTITKPTISLPTRRFSLPRECGVNSQNDRITGGEDAGLGSNPWNVIFRGREASKGGGSCSDSNPGCPGWAGNGECQKNPSYMKNNCKKSCNNCPSGSTGNEIWFCGGVLITEHHVLTAAHCFPNHIEIMFVRIGEYDLSKLIDSERKLTAPQPQDINVARIIEHEEWNIPGCRRCNDIAIAKLAKPAKFHQSFVQPICLPSEPLTDLGFSVAEYQGKLGIATGWGITAKEDSLKATGGSKILQRVELDISEMDFCRQRKRNYPDKNMILCAGNGDGKDTCRGDSGGPLMLSNKFGQIWYAVGITSVGNSVCGIKDVQSVFTNVHYYIDWIKQNLV